MINQILNPKNMKKNLFLIILTIGLLSCNSVTPPLVVSDSFAEKYATAEKVSWDQENPNEWEAEFKMDGKEMSATFDDAGNWTETEIAISEKELPSAVLDALKLKFDTYKIGEVCLIENQEFNGYEVIITKDKSEIEVLVTKDGELTIKEEAKEEE